MMMLRSTTALAALLALAMGCRGEASPEDPIVESALLEAPTIESEIVSTADVWEQIDASRTYWSRLSSVEPESLILALWRAELPISRAWQPLDDRCADPIGPRFTVELAEGDLRILEHNFETGPGRFLCSTTVEQFTISE
jgi:hypothetical protein